MSILTGAEFVVAFYEKLPDYLLSKVSAKANAKDLKKLKTFLQSVKARLEKIKDNVSLHAAAEQKKFIDAFLSLTSDFLVEKRETENAKKQKETIEYALFVWEVLAPLPKKIRQLSRDEEVANESHYYALDELAERVFSNGDASFYIDTFVQPLEKIERAAVAFHEKYVHLATPSVQEGIAFSSTMAEGMKKMCRDFTLIHEFARRTRDTNKYAYVLLMNAMPAVVFEVLENPMTKKQSKELENYIKTLEKQCNQYGWTNLLQDEINPPHITVTLEQTGGTIDDIDLEEETVDEIVPEEPATEPTTDVVESVTTEEVADVPVTEDATPEVTQETTTEEATEPTTDVVTETTNEEVTEPTTAQTEEATTEETPTQTPEGETSEVEDII